MNWRLSFSSIFGLHQLLKQMSGSSTVCPTVSVCCLVSCTVVCGSLSECERLTRQWAETILWSTLRHVGYLVPTAVTMKLQSRLIVPARQRCSIHTWAQSDITRTLHSRFNIQSNWFSRLCSHIQLICPENFKVGAHVRMQNVGSVSRSKRDGAEHFWTVSPIKCTKMDWRCSYILILHHYNIKPPCTITETLVLCNISSYFQRNAF